MLSRKKAQSICLMIALLFAVSCFIYPIGYLSASTDATFTITAPAAGDVLAAGTDYNITWTYTGNPGDKVNLTLYKEGKSSYRIASNVPVGSGGSGSYAIKVYVNGRLLSFDQPPVIIGGRTLVPMGTIFKALGAVVSWDAVNQMVLAAKGDITIKLIIGEGTAQVNGHETVLSQPAQIIGGRTMVPLGFVAQALQADVKWDGTTRTININQNQASSGSAELAFNGKQVVDMFFSSLGSGEVDDAMSLMDAGLLGDNAAKAAWRSLFTTFDTLQVKSIADWNPNEWTLDQQAYKVEFALRLKNGAPETMWMDGLNTRWVFVKPVNGQGRISQLATGP